MHTRFTPVRDCFHDLFVTGRETGASLAVRHDGVPVIELMGGTAAAVPPSAVVPMAGADRAWRPDTLVDVYSTGKPVVALCLLLLVDRGRVDLDAPVSAYWPEFRTPATVRQVLAHTAGLPAFPVPRPAAAIADWGLLCADLAAAEPEWDPGAVAGEHAWTYGHLVGELVRRVDGRPVGRFLAEEIAGPWRLDLAFGLGEADRRRCADLSYADPAWPDAMRGEPGSLRARALDNPPGGRDVAMVNSDLWRAAEIPAVNLHATAPGSPGCTRACSPAAPWTGYACSARSWSPRRRGCSIPGRTCCWTGRCTGRSACSGSRTAAGVWAGSAAAAPGPNRSGATPSRTRPPGWPTTIGWRSWSRRCTPASDGQSRSVIPARRHAAHSAGSRAWLPLFRLCSAPIGAAPS
ncbi:hypothetical protein J3R08_000091 [Micromonospora sp. HB375]|uniref:serine hydrolase domain-containing protein n=1 Tax=unclassified Micromonospora TaxID=2617518 RepID=UPI001F211A82|nr:MULTISPECIES: serine hydrolase domain-containing protein [unclassified Micromonospora]MBP1780241.1 hypothetical protein [Micromonospora sp. HB375]MDH6469845.1 hypothetical protein [Micromonospora sp. H404/HB375]